MSRVVLVGNGVLGYDTGGGLVFWLGGKIPGAYNV